MKCQSFLHSVLLKQFFYDFNAKFAKIFQTLYGEGGEKAIETPVYVELNQKISATGYVDLVDMEAFTGDDAVKAVVEEAHKHGVKVVASNHDFDKTPAKSDIIYRLRKMQELGADIPKIAVMPQNKKDVLTLLAATEEMVNNYADRPIITMSMAATGVISRVCGEVFGSALTFGADGSRGIKGNAHNITCFSVNPDLRSKGDAFKESRYPIFVTLVAAG